MYGEIVCIANKSLPGRVLVMCTSVEPQAFDENFIEQHVAIPPTSRKLATPFYVVFAKQQTVNADEKFEALVGLLKLNFDTDGAFYVATPNDVYPYFFLMDGGFYMAKDFEGSPKPCTVLVRDPAREQDEIVAEGSA